MSKQIASFMGPPSAILLVLGDEQTD